MYGIGAATGFRDDNWFELRFGIQFKPAPNALTSDTYVFRISFRKAGATWSIKFYEQGKPFTVDDSEDGIADFVMRFYKELIQIFSRSLKDVIEGDDITSGIGFRILSNNEDVA